MHHTHHAEPDFGTGQKKLGIYLIGLISCSILTLISFGVVMIEGYSKYTILIIIYSSAILQFLLQVICFLRLNMQTQQARTNVMTFIFTLVILFCVVAGSLWIMWSLNYNMVH